MGQRPDERAASARLRPLRDDEEDHDARGEAGLTAAAAPAQPAPPGAGRPAAAPDRDRRVIVFAHANGFPAGTYRQIFERWRAAGYAVHAIEKLGHDPRYPVSLDWPHLVSQLTDFIDRTVGGPAFLVGHSLGGYLSLMAAAQRPDLAAGVVMLDSPVIAGWKAQVLRLLRTTRLGERVSPSHVSRKRRQDWPDAVAAQAHFAAKPAFARWADGVLADYIRSGIEPLGGGHRLAFDRDVESAIYDTLPTRMTRLLRTHPLRCELAFVRGDRSNEVRQVGMAATERLARGRVSTLPGGHLFPFERPAETAAAVLDWLARMDLPRATAHL